MLNDTLDKSNFEIIIYNFKNIISDFNPEFIISDKFNLTSRQIEYVSLSVLNFSRKEISKIMNVSESTVKSQIDYSVILLGYSSWYSLKKRIMYSDEFILFIMVSIKLVGLV